MAERFMPRAQEIYRHFKGNLYQVQAVAVHTETREQLVIYQAMYGDFKVYARPLDMFTGLVDREKYPDADQVFRFQLQGPEAGRQLAQTTQLQGGTGMIGTAEMQNTGARDSATAEGENPGAQGSATAEEENRGAQGSATAEGENPGAQGSATAEGENRGAQGPAAAERENMTTQGAALTGREPEEISEPEEPGIDPLVLEFLDARTYEQRLNVLAALHHRITNEMITTMSLCCDIEVQGEDVEQRYEELKQCLMMKERFEIKRLV